jgi:hypothetical protein
MTQSITNYILINKHQIIHTVSDIHCRANGKGPYHCVPTSVIHTINIHNSTGVIVLHSPGPSFIISTGHPSFCPAQQYIDISNVQTVGTIHCPN